MGDVVDFAPRAPARTTAPAQVQQALADVLELLQGTINSVYNNNSGDDVRDICVVVCVEKTKQLLREVCNSGDDEWNGKALDAMSLVELARMALQTGPEAFDGQRCISYWCAIGVALHAARERLTAEEDEPDGGGEDLELSA